MFESPISNNKENENVALPLGTTMAKNNFLNFLDLYGNLSIKH